MRAINIGSGDKPIKETGMQWVNADVRDLPNVDCVCEVDAIPFPDGHFMRAYASHILEHFPYRDAQRVVNEWVRILSVAGELWIAVPDFRLVCTDMIGGRLSENDAIPYLYGGQGYKWNFHYNGFTRARLSKIMCEAGLRDIQTWGVFRDDSSKSRYSLNLKGTKK